MAVLIVVFVTESISNGFRRGTLLLNHVSEIQDTEEPVSSRAVVVMLLIWIAISGHFIIGLFGVAVGGSSLLMRKSWSQ